MQLLVGAFVLTLDQLLKWSLADTASVNNGIGWGLFRGNPGLATIVVGFVSVIVLGVIGRAWQRFKTVERLGAALLAAGIAGNLIDRIRVGGVIDPLSVSDWFPHFNLADCAIVVGMIVLLTVRAGSRTEVPDASPPDSALG